MVEMAPAFLVRLEGVSKHYGTRTALDEVGLEVKPAESLALLGHNGAGKTTLLKIILGVTRPSEGHLVVGAEPRIGVSSVQWRRRLGFLPENVAFDSNMTGREMLGFYGSLKGCGGMECDALLERLGLAADAHRRIRTYSKGMRQRLGLAQALLGEPPLLLLDEPTSGLDPVSRRQFYQLIGERVAAGATALICSHSLSEIEAYAQRFVLLQHGRVLAGGTLAQLQEQADIPIRIRLRVPVGAAARIAARIDAKVQLAKVNERTVDLSCTAANKMRVLRDVSRLAGEISDLEIKPPNLEDIYIHMTGGSHTHCE